MSWTNLHIAWLQRTNHQITTSTGKAVEVWSFNPLADPTALKAWAKHFRNHYCADDMIDDLRDGTGLSRAEYLEQLVFPHINQKPGPGIRSGDFAEIMAADYMEYILNFWVPRNRYDDKAVRNESVKGCDTIGFKFSDTDPMKDTMAVFESKAQFSGTKTTPRLQDAVDASAKDYLRQAESLNAMKRRFLKVGDRANGERVKRFQNKEDNAYQELYGAVAHWDENLFDVGVIKATDETQHPHSSKLALIVIKGPSMMQMVNSLYKRAADEA